MVVGAFPNLSKLEIVSKSGAYEILFSKPQIEEDPKNFYLVDSFFKPQLLYPTSKTIYIDSTEINKSLTGVETVLVKLSELGMTKNDLLVVVGGGCIQDLGTLAAAIYMRGVKWTFIPSTLAAMGDSCVGGKSSINAGGVKNLAGNFYPPEKVLIDPSFCKTLPKLEIVAGISEIIKICFARSAIDFSQSIKLINSENFLESEEALNELIFLSLNAKKYFIEEDEFDVGIRKLLNFGHSFGHALESASNFGVPHGVAVLVGMIAAINHPSSIQSKETDYLKRNCLHFLKTVSDQITIPISNFSLNDFSTAISRDKKNTHESLVLVLPGPDGLVIHHGSFKEDSINIASAAMEKTRIEVINEIC
jgi:3-dehydroquinate synthase